MIKGVNAFITLIFVFIIDGGVRCDGEKFAITKSRLYFWLLSICYLCSMNLLAQSDTINQTDSLGRTQGLWKHTVGTDFPQSLFTDKNAVVRYGYYVDGLQEGVWTYNTSEGMIRSTSTYLHDTVNGLCQIFNADGLLTESYIAKGTKIVGDHYLYTADSSGALIQHRLGGVKGHVSKIRPNKIPGPPLVSITSSLRGYQETDRYMRVDSFGNYEFYELLPGYYKIRCEVAGADFIEESILIKNDDTLVFDFVMEPDHSGDPGPVGCLGLNICDEPGLEVRFGLIKMNMERLDWHSDELTIGSEINFSLRDFIIGPKLNYTRTKGLLFFGIPYGGSLTYYTDFKQGALYFQPHIGFQLFFIVDLALGYNFCLQQDSEYFRNRVSGLMLSGTIRLYNPDKYW